MTSDVIILVILSLTHMILSWTLYLHCCSLLWGTYYLLTERQLSLVYNNYDASVKTLTLFWNITNRAFPDARCYVRSSIIIKPDIKWRSRRHKECVIEWNGSKNWMAVNTISPLFCRWCLVRQLWKCTRKYYGHWHFVIATLILETPQVYQSGKNPPQIPISLT